MKSEPAVETSVVDFHKSLQEQGIRRAYIINNGGSLLVSHPDVLKSIEELLHPPSQDYAGHEAIFIGRDDAFPTVFFAFVHCTRRGLAQGGLRFKPYGAVAELVSDGLRLSRGMTRKNALAKLWWGGGKGIIARTPELAAMPGLMAPTNSPDHVRKREQLFESYGRFVASLGGVYYTAEDIGTRTQDMNAILRQNRFVTCIGSELGGSGNPSESTAKGVLRSIQAAWGHLNDGNENLKGARVSIQGVGNVGRNLARLLKNAGAKLTLTDADKKALDEVVAEVGGTGVEKDAIFDASADIFAPCAIGAQINSLTIPRLNQSGVRLICGAANNMLDREEDGAILHQKGILFIPDFVSNRMGIFNCADEWRGPQLQEDLDAAIEGVYLDTKEVLKLAREASCTPAEAADRWADSESLVAHPLFGHRGSKLIQRLTASNWLEA